MNNTTAFRYAAQASLRSDFPRCHTGCVATYAGHVIAQGWNSSKTHSIQSQYNRYRGFDVTKFRGTMHAEMMVVNKIRNLDINFSQVKIYVHRGNGKLLLSRPCPACERALRDIGIKKIYYTGYNSYISERYN